MSKSAKIIRPFNYLVDNGEIYCCKECTSFLTLPVEIKNREKDITWVTCHDCCENSL